MQLTLEMLMYSRFTVDAFIDERKNYLLQKHGHDLSLIEHTKATEKAGVKKRLRAVFRRVCEGELKRWHCTCVFIGIEYLWAAASLTIKGFISSATYYIKYEMSRQIHN